jgi:hypothetical protein
MDSLRQVPEASPIRLGFFFLAAMLVILSVVPLAHADSDGCYCTGNGYLAYELRFFRTPGPEAPHVLRVIRFDDGMRQAGEVIMEDFQVHQMTCDADRIEIAGFGKNYIKYAIDIRQPEALSIASRIEEPPEQHPLSEMGPAPRQLGLSPPETIRLQSRDLRHTYRLVLARTSRPVPGGVEDYRTAELLQFDANGEVSERMLLYEDHRPAERGE